MVRIHLPPAKSLRTFQERKYDTPLVEAEYKLEAAAADPVAAQALQVSAGSPIFLIGLVEIRSCEAAWKRGDVVCEIFSRTAPFSVSSAGRSSA
jgi:hypothetical protein